MGFRSIALSAVLTCAVGLVPERTEAADLEGLWNITAGATFDLDIVQFGPFILVDERQAGGTIEGIGLTFGVDVVWIDELSQVYWGTADSPGVATTTSGRVTHILAPSSIPWNATKYEEEE